ncbi:hypothetical protein D1AOALGA4SA_6461 [Olavius algarvensis Delta 1 endosymbiont]|nr:hypothetical protein D1AOALGA4SA_6461 [Olavius algarvensis Delta 1 endosymbiont]
MAQLTSTTKFRYSVAKRLYFFRVRAGKSGPGGAALAQFVGFRFQVSGFSAASGLKSGQSDL